MEAASCLWYLADVLLLVHFLDARGSKIWSYYAYNMEIGKYEIILDAGKVKFLREKCG